MRPVPRLLIYVAAMLIGIDLFNGAVAPLGLPPAVETAVALLIGIGAARLTARALGEPAPSDAAPDDPA